MFAETGSILYYLTVLSDIAGTNVGVECCAGGIAFTIWVDIIAAVVSFLKRSGFPA
jgi:hypothetical protein